MEPGATLFQPMSGRAYTPTAAHDREFLNSLRTMVPFPKDLIERIPDKWWETIYESSPRLAPNGKPLTLDFVPNISEIPVKDWAFMRDVLQPDPKAAPSAGQRPQQSWLNF